MRWFTQASAPGAPEKKTIEELRAEAATRQAALTARKVADIEALEKPVEKFRIIRKDFNFDGAWDYAIHKTPPPKSGWYVETWAVSSYGYHVLGEPAYRYASALRDERWDLEYHLYKEVRSEPRVYVQWHPVGPGAAFSTIKAAEKWLKNWLNPEAECVPLAADGSRLSRPQNPADGAQRQARLERAEPNLPNPSKGADQ